MKCPWRSSVSPAKNYPRSREGNSARSSQQDSWITRTGVLLAVSILLLGNPAPLASAAAASGTIPCDDSSACSSIVGPGSECHQGLCSNPFVSGCLRALLGQETENPAGDNNHTRTTSTRTPDPVDPMTTMRVCNSDDDEETIVAKGLCLPSPLDYMEIRILTGNWESSLLTAWALQILLSEWMQVPTSIESSSPDRKANFYHATNQFDYGAIAYDYTALEVAHQFGDCRERHADAVQDEKFVETEGDLAANPTGNLQDGGGESSTADDYVACAHIMPEAWNGQKENLWSLTKRRIIEAPEGNGVVGKLTWFIPKYVAEQNPEWAHYSGWSRNRTQIASSFRRPLTWGQYCQSISNTQCETPDEVASRRPEDEEEGLYFHAARDGEGYIGYFHATEQNNCEAHPDNCTGHFTAFPCDWSSYAVPQAYHLLIAVESNGNIGPNGGYSYGEKLQIWRAANATQSKVVMTWYTPDPTYQWYRGTEAEFQEVQLPPPSPDCVSERVTVEERCSEDLLVRAGDPLGACGAEVQTLKKVVVQNLYNTIYKSRSKGFQGRRDGTLEGAVDDIDRQETDAKRSPAYEAVKNFHISEFGIGEMFEHWKDRMRERGHAGYSTFSGTTGADPRHAVCQWVADNHEHLSTFVPFTYPRVLQEDHPYDNPIFKIAMGFGVFVMACIVVMGIVTCVFREKPAFKTAQLPFLYMVLLGLLTVSTGAVFFSLEPQSETCVARSWLITMGYTLELVPLIVKIGAINTMLQAAKRMRRVTIERQKLFGIVGGICLLVAGFMTAWTLVDPPSRGTQLTVHLDDNDDFSEKGSNPAKTWWQSPATPISVSYYCRSSGSAAWFTISIVWQCLLLLCAAVLAMQTRRIQHRWNESRSLAIMIYSQSGFVVLRFLLWLFEAPSGVSAHFLDVCRSFVFSLDAFLALLIYFGSKLVEVYKARSETDTSQQGGRFSSRWSLDDRSRKRLEDLSRRQMEDGSGRKSDELDISPAGRNSLESIQTVSEYVGAIAHASFPNDGNCAVGSRGIRTSMSAGDIMMPLTPRLAIWPEGTCNDISFVCSRCKQSDGTQYKPVGTKPSAARVDRSNKNEIPSTTSDSLSNT